MNGNFYLIHGGPGSGRYPWGSGNRPYQRLEGSKRKSSGISGYIKTVKQKKAEKQQQKTNAEAQKKAEDQAENERRLAADKERVLREGTAAEVMKYQGRLTNQELQNAYTRLNLEKQLRGLSRSEIKSAMDKVDNIMKTVKTGTEWVKIGTESYNAFAAIYNATPDGSKNPLPLVGKGDGGGKKK